MAVRTLLRSLVPSRAGSRDVDAQQQSERGATLAEYGLLVGLVVTVSIGAIGALSDTSGAYLEATSEDIGSPRLENELIPNDLPDEPDWLPQPPDGDPGPVDPGVPGVGPGAATVLNAGLFNTTTGSCFTSETPDTDGSAVVTAACDSSAAQAFVGTETTAPNATIQFQAEMADNLCFSAAGGVGTDVTQNACDGTPQQDWQIETNTAIVLRNAGDPTLCLAETAGRLTVETCDFGPAQQFQ